jgi:hypothetical protein
MTAQRTGGVCMPCKQGNRENLEASKRYYEKQKEYDPDRELWTALVNRVHKTEKGISGLSREEKVYFSTSVLDGEIYNGGFEQYFWNSSGDMIHHAIDGLEIIGAHRALDLLMQAKGIVFGDLEPIVECGPRREYLHQKDSKLLHVLLDPLDREYWKNSDGVSDRLSRFAEAHKLIDPFKKQK